MRKKILIIDDDNKLNKLLSEYLGNFGYAVTAETRPVEGLNTLKRLNPDLIILDIMLPQMDGFEVLKEIRKKYSLPVIMLTARGDVTDRVVGLEIGADDYVPKPFEPRELVARIQSVLRRTESKPSIDILKFNGLEIDFIKKTALVQGENVNLTSMEFAVLSVFVKSPGKVFDRDQLMDHLKGIEIDAFDRSIDVLMSRLRKKLKDNPKNPSFFKTLYGSGYVFIGEKLI